MYYSITVIEGCMKQLVSVNVSQFSNMWSIDQDKIVISYEKNNCLCKC